MENISALGELAEFAEQTAFNGVARCARGKLANRTGLADNILRAARHVERAKPQRPPEINPPQAKPKSAPTPTPIAARKSARLGRTVSDYRSLVEVCRQRADELEISRSEIDRLGGLPAGYAGKLLGKASVELHGKNYKKMWPVSLELMLGVLGLKILLIEDDAATAKTLALRKPVKQNQQRFGICRLSVRLTSQTAGVLRSPHKKRRGGKYG